ncbi:MAG: hypothetical protein IPO28_02415 [Holophagaceae bacterium]|nr:hypothetical protein [Holophagaceae bacterium]
MNARFLLWISAPVALSVGVLWLSAQEPKGEPKAALAEGVKVAELASQLQNRERAIAQKEAELRQLEQRLTTLQATLDKDRGDLAAREKAVQEALAKVENLKQRPAIDPQIIRTYEAMDPAAGAQAMKELASQNLEVAVALLAGMTPKKAGKLMDQLAPLDAKLAGRLSERVGMSRPKDPPPPGSDSPFLPNDHGTVLAVGPHPDVPGSRRPWRRSVEFPFCRLPTGRRRNGPKPRAPMPPRAHFPG